MGDGGYSFNSSPYICYTDTAGRVLVSWLLVVVLTVVVVVQQPRVVHATLTSAPTHVPLRHAKANFQAHEKER